MSDKLPEIGAEAARQASKKISNWVGKALDATKDHPGLVERAMSELRAAVSLSYRHDGGAYLDPATFERWQRIIPALLSQARADALEEAAKVAEQYAEDKLASPLIGWTVVNARRDTALRLAAAIRSLSATRKGSGG